MPLRLDWDSNPETDLVTGYIVQESADGAPFSQKAVTADNFLVFNPAPGNYAWRVIAANFVGQSQPSEPVQGPGVPSQPGQPTVTLVP